MLIRRAPIVWTVGVSLAGLLASIAGCGNTPMTMTPDAAFHCTSNADCDDSADCTVDTCNASGMCNYMPVDALCTAPQTCQVGVGCTSQMFCNTAAMCDDSIACTIDSCDVGNVCGHMALDALCTMPGMTHCDAAMGCVPGSTTTCASAADCNDDVACTLDSCGADHACRHAVMDSLCTGTDEHCDATLGCQTRHGCATAADCVEFYNFCDGDPTCDPEFGCQAPPSARVCNDGNACTLDSCDPAAGARGACAATCDRSMTACATTEPLCAVSGPTCSGVFDVTGPDLVGGCPGGGLSWDFTRLTFENTSGIVVSITPRRLRSGVASLVLSDSAAPVCPEFTAVAVVDGGCREEYEVSGMFTDDDTVSGTVRVDFIDADGISCLLAACTPVVSTFSGTRM